MYLDGLQAASTPMKSSSPSEPGISVEKLLSDGAMIVGDEVGEGDGDW